MPKKQIDFSKACVYKICCNDVNITDVYVGSTTNLVQRRYTHKNACVNPKNKKYNCTVYRFIRDHGGFENWSVVLCEKVICGDKNELIQKEREWFEKLNSTLNRQYPNRSVKEYRVANSDKIKEKRREYRVANFDKIKEKRREYYVATSDKFKEYNKKYYIANTDKIKTQQKEKITCDICNSLITRVHMARHKRTKKCQSYLVEQPPPYEQITQ